MKGVPACGCVVGTGWSLRSLPTPNQSVIVWTTDLAWRWGGLLHTLVCCKCFSKLLHHALLLLQLQITAASHSFHNFQKTNQICSYFTGLRWKEQQFSRAMHHLQRGKILKTCLATLIWAEIPTLSNISTCSDDPICFPRGLDFANSQAIPHHVPSQMNPTFVQCMAESFARWCLSPGRPAAPQSAGWTSPSAALSAGSRSHPELSPPGYFS